MYEKDLDIENLKQTHTLCYKEKLNFYFQVYKIIKPGFQLAS